MQLTPFFVLVVVVVVGGNADRAKNRVVGSVYFSLA